MKPIAPTEEQWLILYRKSLLAARRKGFRQQDAVEIAAFVLVQMPSIYSGWDGERSWVNFVSRAVDYAIVKWIQFNSTKKRKTEGRIYSIDLEMEHEDYDIPDLDTRQPFEIVSLREEFDRIMRVLNKKERKEAIRWANGVPARDNAHVSLRYYTIRQKALKLLDAEDYVEYLYWIRRRRS